MDLPEDGAPPEDDGTPEDATPEDAPPEDATNVIAHDFGHEPRLKARRFRRLLDLDALHEANLRENPLPYLERASERIFRLESALFEANLAAGKAGEALSQIPDATGTATIGRAELASLLACRAIVKAAFEALVQGRADDE
jgi:hypothetical protein